LFGGGRWAHIIFGVLCDSLDPNDCVLWHTRHGMEAADALLSQVPPKANVAAYLVAEIDEIWRARPRAAIVATAPATHVEVAMAALRQNVPVLVEKPIALSLRDADELLALSEDMDVPLGVNLEYSHAAYLHELSKRVPPKCIADIRITWIDSLVERRPDAVKQADLMTHRCLDIYPHLWSILRNLTGKAECTVDEVTPCDTAPDALLLTGRTPDTPFSAELSRRGGKRVRAVDITTNSGAEFRLDFSQEPGQLSIDGAAVPFDCKWEHSPRPLAAALLSFLRVAQEGKMKADWPLDARRCRPHLVGALAAAEKAGVAESAWIAARLRVSDLNLAARLVDNLVPELAARGFAEIARECAGNPATVDALAAAAIAKLVPAAAKADLRLEAALQDSPFLAAVYSSYIP